MVVVVVGRLVGGRLVDGVPVGRRVVVVVVGRLVWGRLVGSVVGTVQTMTWVK